MNKFTELEIPYDELKTLGLTQEMIDDLPQPVMGKLLSGQHTPPMEITYSDKKGEKHSFLSSIVLKRDGEGLAAFLVPRWEEAKLDQFTKEEQDVLLRGDILRMTLPSGKKGFAQFDEDLHQLMMVEEEIVLHNLNIINKDKDINEEEIEQIMQGIPTELRDEEVITVGVNLKDWNGLHITDGNVEKWREEVGAKLNKYNFGLYGCWISDPISGALSYVPEENYTEEMENEIRRVGQQRVSSEQISRMRL